MMKFREHHGSLANSLLTEGLIMIGFIKSIFNKKNKNEEHEPIIDHSWREQKGPFLSYFEMLVLSVSQLRSFVSIPLDERPKRAIIYLYVKGRMDYESIRDLLFPFFFRPYSNSFLIWSNNGWTQTTDFQDIKYLKDKWISEESDIHIKGEKQRNNPLNFC